MRKIRETVSTEAVFQVPTLRPHRNSVQSKHSMWLLCAGARDPGLPIEAGLEYTEEMRDLSRRPRAVELPLPNQEG